VELFLLSDLFRKLGAKKLEKLSFIFQETEMTGDKEVKFITKNVRHLTKLTSLDFQIYNFYNVTGTFLAPLKQSLRLLPSLKHFKIMTELCDMFGERGFNYILNGLNGLNAQNIQSLYFDLSRVRKDLSDFLPRLMHKMEDFPELRKFGLHLVEDPIGLAAFQESMSVIPKLKKLEEISFSATDPISHGEHQALMQSLGMNSNIKDIYFKISDLQKTGFEMLNKSLANLNTLERLKLNLTVPTKNDYDDDNNHQAEVNPEFLDDECWRNLGLSLKKHSKTLKMFSFGLNIWYGDIISANITSRGCGDLAQALADCSNIENLCLMYFNTMEPKDITATFRAIQNMKGIKSLVLKLQASEPVGTDSIAALKEALAAITHVKKLYLVLSNFQAVTDQDMKGLLGEVSKLKDMVDFCFALEMVPKLTQASLEMTVETLKNLKALKTAQLSFIIGPSKKKFGPLVCLEMEDIDDRNKQIKIKRQDISFALNRLTHKLNHD